MTVYLVCGHITDIWRQCLDNCNEGKGKEVKIFQYFYSKRKIRKLNILKIP